jgi:uncharacterized membrane protein
VPQLRVAQLGHRMHEHGGHGVENHEVRRSTHARAPILSAVAGAIAVLAVIGLAILWPSGKPRPDVPALSSFEGAYAATTIERIERTCTGADASTRCLSITFRLLEGPNEGTAAAVELPVASPRVAGVNVGTHVLLGHQPDVEGFEYVFLEPDRRFPLLALAGVFALAVVALGGWKGMSALVGLLATLLVLFLFVAPAILDGRDPLLVSLVGSVVIAFAALYLSHGVDAKTTVALLGTLGGLLCAAAFAVAFMNAARITGLASEEALFLTALGTHLDLRGLILGGMMIGALGAIDDITVTQASAIWELRSVDPKMSRGRLLRSGMRIGRDHVASTVNTLVLAYAGASMPLLILFVLSDQPTSTVANGEIVATEIVRTLVGSLGLIASVPITTWLAVEVVSSRGRHATTVIPATADADDARPEEHAIPEHRRDIWIEQFRSWRSSRGHSR